MLHSTALSTRLWYRFLSAFFLLLGTACKSTAKFVCLHLQLELEPELIQLCRLLLHLPFGYMFDQGIPASFGGRGMPVTRCRYTYPQRCTYLSEHLNPTAAPLIVFKSIAQCPVSIGLPSRHCWNNFSTPALTRRAGGICVYRRTAHIGE